MKSNQVQKKSGLKSSTRPAKDELLDPFRALADHPSITSVVYDRDSESLESATGKPVYRRMFSGPILDRLTPGKWAWIVLIDPVKAPSAQNQSEIVERLVAEAEAGVVAPVYDDDGLIAVLLSEGHLREGQIDLDKWVRLKDRPFAEQRRALSKMLELARKLVHSQGVGGPEKEKKRQGAAEIDPLVDLTSLTEAILPSKRDRPPAIERLENILQRAQIEVPSNIREFVEQANAIMSAFGYALQLPSRRFGKLSVNRDGTSPYIQIQVSGAGNIGFKKTPMKLVRVRKGAHGKFFLATPDD